MWDSITYWFDIAIVLGIFAFGNILFGHFEEHRPKWRRCLKVVFVIGLASILTFFQLRWLFYLLLSIAGLAAVYIHVIWLPKNGIHGWTGEPKDKYLELVSGKKEMSSAKK